MDDPTLINYLKKAVPGLITLYRFGSTNQERARSDSDVDLAILFHKTIPSQHLFELTQDLAIQLHRDVDLIDLRTASTVMRMQIISTGTCLACLDVQSCREFEMYVYSDYARLNEERRDSMMGIKRSGLVYG